LADQGQGANLPATARPVSTRAIDSKIPIGTPVFCAARWAATSQMALVGEAMAFCPTNIVANIKTANIRTATAMSFTLIARAFAPRSCEL
jgi:hypothetical protein